MGGRKSKTVVSHRELKAAKIEDARSEKVCSFLDVLSPSRSDTKVPSKDGSHNTLVLSRAIMS